MLNGRTLQVMNEDGDWLMDDSFLLLVNASHQGVEFTLPESPSGNHWQLILNTEDAEEPFAVVADIDDKVIVGGRGLKLLSDRSVTGI
jgi:glycogen operon protein